MSNRRLKVASLASSSRPFPPSRPCRHSAGKNSTTSVFSGRHALSDQLTIGAILLFLSYLGSLYAPLEAVMYSTSTIQGAAGSAKRVVEILESEGEVADKPGAQALSSVRGHVQIDNVTFGYEPGRPVLHR